MLAKKLRIPAPEARESGLVSVTVEPKPDSSDADVIANLERLGAEAVKLLAPGFISARAPLERLAQIQDIAFVHIKPLKQVRSF